MKKITVRLCVQGVTAWKSVDLVRACFSGDQSLLLVLWGQAIAFQNSSGLIRETEVAIKFDDAARRAGPKSVSLTTLDFRNPMANELHFPS